MMVLVNQKGFVPVFIVFVVALGLLTIVYSARNKPVSLNNQPASVPTAEPSPTRTEQAEEKPSVEKTAKEVVNFLKDKNLEKLSTSVHPTEGIRFSPYTFVDLQKDQVFTKDQTKTLNQDSTKYNWGVYDGSGLPINLTFSEYWNKFIYDKDFALSTQISVNGPIGQGNTLNNIAEVYPNGTYVEYYIPGSEEMGGMDWGSLRLVFEQVESKWYLVGIVHDQWTI